MSQITVKDIVQGNSVEGVELLVEKRSEATTKTGKSYLNLTLRDRSGSIPARLWNYSETAHGFFRENDVLKIWAAVEEYNGILQLNIKDIALGSGDASQFARRTPFDVEQMWGDLVTLVGSFKEPLTKFVTEEILLKQSAFVEAYKKAPAAKTVHNNWFGGLLEHVHSLCTIADPIIRHYQTKYCEKISRDKILFGLMMHDAGKVVEYDYTKPGFNLTGIGIFTNHLVLGPAWVYETANRFGTKGPDFKMERAHLMHVLAAHHGRLDWGSPVVPASIEAILVHHLDNLDAKVLHALDFAKGKPGSISGFSEQSYFEKTPFFQYPST